MSKPNPIYERNRLFAFAFDKGSLPLGPSLSTVILTCMDSRVDPAHFASIELGEVMTLRNGGGRVTEEIERNLAIIWRLTGRDKPDAPPLELAIIHHTHCGMEKLADPAVRGEVGETTGLAESILQSWAITDHDQALQDDLARLRESKLAPRGLLVSGHIYDIKSGELQSVFDPTPL